MNGTYTATVTDMAGNKGTCSATIDSINDSSGYSVKVVVINGTVDSSAKYVQKETTATFNLTPNNPNHTPSYTCTNKQEASLVNNVLTITPTSDTVCTVRYDTYQTVLYTDGTLIINEGTSDRTSNIATHGAVTNTYNPWSNSESYVSEFDEDYFEFVTLPLWSYEGEDIIRVEIGSPVKPVSTSGWFVCLPNIEYGDFTLLDTSNTVDMSYMFFEMAIDSSSVLIGLDNWDVSKVIDMSYMFYGVFTDTLFDIEKWDVSSVENMRYMLTGAGSGVTDFEINLSNWDVSNVTDMKSMLAGIGNGATTWSIGDLSNWNVSKVTDMSCMFVGAGEDATTWDIGDISNWDVSNVTSMYEMFEWAGYSASMFSLDLSNWDVSNVASIGGMFDGAGYEANIFKLDLSGWNLLNVTSMEYNNTNMFGRAGLHATTWSVTIPRKTGSLNNTTSIFYGKDSSVYTAPSYGRSFTLASS